MNSDTFFERLKINPVLKFFYKFPIADRLYHTALGFLGAVYYGFPSRKIKVIGITGTKGKTTTTDLVYSLLLMSGKKVALLSSARMAIGADSEKNIKGNSMPGRGYIQGFLKKAVDAHCEYAVLEVTSQGVLLSRHRFIDWAFGGITNIQPEHIEAHGSFENYRASKLAFLKLVAKKNPVFINKEEGNADFLSKNLRAKNLNFYSKNDLPKLPDNVKKFLPGDFNLENIALAVSIVRKIGLSEEAIYGALDNFRGVSGRSEFIQREPFVVMVDYAHTADSLRAIYETVKALTPGKLIAVLGAAGGGRDKWKRPEMGSVVASYATEIILTDEDPYDEDPLKILNEVRSGIPEGHNVSEIINRKEAIFEAVRRAGPGDAVLITGKGSESFIHLANGELMEWSDQEIAEEALRARH